MRYGDELRANESESEVFYAALTHHSHPLTRPVFVRDDDMDLVLVLLLLLLILPHVRTSFAIG